LTFRRRDAGALLAARCSFSACHCSGSRPCKASDDAQVQAFSGAPCYSARPARCPIAGLAHRVT
jgi:hypothetical protein